MQIDELLADFDLGDFEAVSFVSTQNENTDYVQFIVMTHRRGTMTAADRLYGITMQEKGVSTLVSVDLLDKELTN